MVEVTAVLLALLGKFWPYIVGGAGILFAMWKARQSGALAERAKAAEAERRARSIADEIDDAIAGRSPGANREELKKWRER